MPTGTPTATASRKPTSTRRKVAAMLSSSARAVHKLGKLRNTSPGLGSTTGEMRRDSGVAPSVNAHHSSRHRPIAPRPTARATAGGGTARSANRGGRRVGTIGVLVGRLEGIHFDLDATDRKSTRLNSSHSQISYAVFCLKKKTDATTVTMPPPAD